jgi:hypothetical protein
MTEVYSDNEQLVKTFTAGVPNSVLRFDFNFFDIENGIFSMFKYDWLYVYDGADTTSNQIEGSPFSGIIIPSSILSSGSQMTFKFVSDYAATKNGWSASVSCQAIPDVDGKVLISSDLKSYPYIGSSESISVDVWNEGSLDLQNFTVSYVLDDQNVVSEEVTGSLKPGEMMRYTFSKGVNFSEAGLDYKITAWLSMLDDTNRANDTSSVVIRNTLKDTVFLMSNESVTSSNCIFYDTGGPDDTHSGDEYFVKTFTTERPDEKYIFEMYLDIELGYDFISIYDGKDTTSAAILTNSSGNGTRIFESSGRSLTFKFNSDPAYNRAGWRADLKGVQVSETDVSVKYLEAPITSNELGSKEKIGIWVYNSGSLAQKDVMVSYVVNQEETITETIHGILPAMSDTLFYFQTTADLSEAGVKYHITTWSNVLNDENRENDTLFYGAQNTSGTPMSYFMNSTPVTADAGWFYDSGGPDERYRALENSVKTFTAKSSDSRLRFIKEDFELRRNDDYLMVFDGDDVYAPVIAGSPFHDGNVPTEIQSSGPSLTFQFGSDHWGQNNGWEFYFESFRVPAKNLKVISFKGLFDGPLSDNEKIEINLFNGGFHHAFRGTAYYSINDGPAVGESITPLGGLQSGIHTFATSADLSESGKEYSIKAWVEIEGHTPFEYDYFMDTVRNTTGDLAFDGISNLGGYGRNDLELVAISGTTLHNTYHPLDTSNQTSSYHNFPIEESTTALLRKGETYEFEISSILHYSWSGNATISAWIDFNQDGEFEANEWIQVAWVANFNVPNFISFIVPENAVTGQTKMRIRTRVAQYPNGAEDANVNFGNSGVTEDYTITIE